MTSKRPKAPSPARATASSFLQPFSEYHTPSAEDFKREWGRCTFILDTNVLLNLYRYPKSASDDVLKVLEKLKDRLWIPHHVALEFHSRRRTVLREQIGTFGQTISELNQAEKKLEDKIKQIASRHYLIKPDLVVPRLTKVFEEIREQLAQTEEEQKSIVSEDHILKTLAAVFDGRVGPDDPELRGRVVTDGQARFKSKIPPGYMDADKNDDAPCLVAGVSFDRRFADLLVWEQIIDFVKAQSIKSAILVTDDRKEDWWWHDSTKQPRGPRPELIEELRRRAGAEFFHMYTSDRFVKYANEHLQTRVSESTVESVRDIATSAPTPQAIPAFRHPRSRVMGMMHLSDPIHLVYPPYHRERIEALFRATTRSMHGDCHLIDIASDIFDWALSGPQGIDGFRLVLMDPGADTERSASSQVLREIERLFNAPPRPSLHRFRATIIFASNDPARLTRVISRTTHLMHAPHLGPLDLRIAVGDVGTGRITFVALPTGESHGGFGSLPKPP